MDLKLIKKRPHGTAVNFEECIICQETDPSIEINNLTRDGATTLINAMQTYKDCVYDRLQFFIMDVDEFLSNKPKCHRSCRSSYHSYY